MIRTDHESAISMRGRRKELSQIVLVILLKILGIFQTFSVIRCLLTEYLKRAAEESKPSNTDVESEENSYAVCYNAQGGGDWGRASLSSVCN